MFMAILFLYIIISIILMVYCIRKSSKAALIILSILWWLMSAVSALFALWAWTDRAYSENWAMIGFLFVSLPIIFVTILMTIIFIIIARIKKNGLILKTELFIYMLIFFLSFQVVAGFIAFR